MPINGSYLTIYYYNSARNICVILGVLHIYVDDVEIYGILFAILYDSLSAFRLALALPLDTLIASYS